MNGRQAVIDALLHKEHDTVPYHYNFTNQALTKIAMIDVFQNQLQYL